MATLGPRRDRAGAPVSTWTRLTGDGQPLPDDREDGLSLYARQLIEDRPPEPPARAVDPSPVLPRPVLRVLPPTKPAEAPQAPVAAPDDAPGATPPTAPPWWGERIDNVTGIRRYLRLLREIAQGGDPQF